MQGQLRRQLPSACNLPLVPQEVLSCCMPAWLTCRSMRCADPLYNDETFLLSVVFLEELGATGNKGLTSLLSNPVINDGVAGLATSATAFAAVEVSTCLDLLILHSAILHNLSWMSD